ncbi:hypothetical protein O181_002568 [Austropuccinia psidii MF-1]|uniref:Integrase catalytic domain-containing protein n=1 Tax=Austropuccinia psidii MF-1 TaxID=1389203 RepID=A0A9Q3BCZ4_9BASI|nr:hypothetical protein [Austropuccinia psidii MF-1]
MLKLGAVDGLNPSCFLADLERCKPCSLVKRRHVLIIPPSTNIVNSPRDVLVVDLMGPFPPSIDKFIYALIVQDHFSSLVAFIPLKAKSEAEKCVIEWIKQFERLTSTKIKCMQSDNGREFNSRLMEDFLVSEGIRHERTIPYKNHQNGKVVRMQN